MQFIRLIILAGSLFAASPAFPQAKGEAKVTARLTPDGVCATISLDRAETRFRLAPADVVRDGEFDILTPGLVLSGGEIQSSTPFRRFDLRIRPMTEERDAKYPAHYRVGSGGLIYGPALVADPAAWRTRLRLVTRPGDFRLPRSADPADGFSYIGPASLVADRPEASMVSAPGTPAWLVERTRTDFDAAVRSFTASLGTRLPHKPLLVVTHDDGRPQVVADVTRPGTITIRFHGSQWREPDPLAAEQIKSLVLHEAFHLWNGSLVHNGENVPAWLHEGGAEYASLFAGRAAGAWDDAAVRKRLGQALSRCRTSLKGQSLDEAKLSSQVRYPCGMALQWFADLHIRQKSGGSRNVLDAWSELIGKALARPNRSYTLDDFYAASGFASGSMPAAMSLMLRTKGEERWDQMIPAIEALGARVSPEVDPHSRLATLMFHVLSQHCPKGQPYGFFSESGAIKLDTEGRCGPLAGAPVVKAIEDQPVFDTSSAMFDAVTRKCAAEANVIFTTLDGKTLAASCTQPLQPPAPGFAVQSWVPEGSR